MNEPVDNLVDKPLFRIKDQKVAYRGFTRLDILQVEQLSRSGKLLHLTREIETHGNGAAVLAYDASRRSAILVRQLRVPVGISHPEKAYLLEVIAGLIDHGGEGAAETARREAVEEAGLRLDDLVEVTRSFTSPGISTEQIWLYLAEADFTTARIAKGGGVEAEQEDIEVVEMALKDLAQMVDRGDILDIKTFTLIQTLRLRRPDLFL